MRDLVSAVGCMPLLDRALHFNTRYLLSDLFRHFGQLLPVLFGVSVRVKFCDIRPRRQMRMGAGHAEAFNSYAYPFGIGGLFYRFGCLPGCLKDSGVELRFQLEDIIDVGFRNQEGVARVTGAGGEEV